MLNYFNFAVFAVLIISCWEINRGVKQQNTAKVLANIFYAVVLALFFAAI